MLLMIDNYDSFTYNLVQYFGEMHCPLEVFRNDAITVPEIKKRRPQQIVISPGPGRPEDAGVSVEIITELAGQIPILGVCLGHQCIGHAYGGSIVQAKRLMHGKTSLIAHDGKGIFENVEDPFQATRYHSLVIERATLPDCLLENAWTQDDDREIMGVRHKEFPLWGVQFHPESVLTDAGKQILRNFLNLGTS